MHTLGSNASVICALDLMAPARSLNTTIDDTKTNLDQALIALERELTALLDASTWGRA